MKVITAGISYATAIAVYKLIPLALRIPSPIQLEKEINDRKEAQGKLESLFARSMVTTQVTREIRKNLKLEAICSATTEQCGVLFNADICSLYRLTAHNPETEQEHLDEQRDYSGEVQLDTPTDTGNDIADCHILSEYNSGAASPGDDNLLPPFHLLPGYRILANCI